MAITDLIAIPQRINRGLSDPRQATMISLLGVPRDRLDDECRDATNPKLLALLVTEKVGPFKVRGLRPAVASLREVLADVRNEAPDVHEGLGTQGMLCVRHVRGNPSRISNHAWGTAIDIQLNGVLDQRGDGRVQEGLARIAPIFHRHGWFWGAGFDTEDGMHFGVSEELIRQWVAEGVLDGNPLPPDGLLSLGDSGPEVRALQEALNAQGADLVVDGRFDPRTHAAVMAFQASHGLTVDGVAGPKTKGALGLA